LQQGRVLRTCFGDPGLGGRTTTGEPIFISLFIVFLLLCKSPDFIKS
jgi:hypothetical protein